MPRKPRFVIPGVPQHVIQRGHNQVNPGFPKGIASWIRPGGAPKLEYYVRGSYFTTDSVAKMRAAFKDLIKNSTAEPFERLRMVLKDDAAIDDFLSINHTDTGVPPWVE